MFETETAKLIVAGTGRACGKHDYEDSVCNSIGCSKTTEDCRNRKKKEQSGGINNEN
jgi:hypothetical protein